MATTIVTKSGSGAPTASDLVAGELAIDLTNGRLYTENSGGTVLELGLNPNGNVDVTGTVTATGTSVFASLDISGDIDVDGTTNLDVVDIDGAVDMASTLAVGGKVRVGAATDGTSALMTFDSASNFSSLQMGNNSGGGSAGGVLLYGSSGNEFAIYQYTGAVGSETYGAPTFSLNSIGGATFNPSASGFAVFNESSADADFRVESNDNANMLFVDGTNNRVGIGKTPATHPFEVGGITTILPSSDGDALIVGKSGGSNLYFFSNASASLITNASGAGAARDGFQITSGNVLTEIDTVAKLSVSAAEVVVNDTGADTDFRVESANTSAALFVDGTNGKVVLGGTTANADLYITKTTAGEVVRADNSQDNWTGVMYYSVIFGTGNNNGSTSADRHFQGYAGGAARFIVCGNGDVKNNNNSYGAISDLKLKENIVDSGSQWDDIKALRIRKYSMKDEYSDVPTQIGVIAQELEAAGMGGLVTEGADLDVDNNDLGTTTKQVTYSVLYMKAVKALQEAMERIESLESRVAALES